MPTNVALRSQEKADSAIASGKFAEEIVPVQVAGKKGAQLIIDKDESPRKTTLEKLNKLSPVYDDGICTAGNSSAENDGGRQRLSS